MMTLIGKRRRVRTSLGSKLFDAANYLFMTLLMVVMAYPIVSCLAISVSSSKAVTAGLVTWYPIGFNTVAYKYMLSSSRIPLAYANTIFYCVCGTLFTLTVTSMFAYSLSIANYVFRPFLTRFIAVTMFFGGGLIPSYLLNYNLGLIDNRLVLIIPGAIGAYDVFVYRTFFKNIPAAMRESAYIDGANDVVILLRIILPMSMALIATMALFNFVGRWNSFFEAMIYINSKDKQPMQIVLRSLLIDNQMTANEIQMMSHDTNAIIPMTIKCAAICITVGPILFIYPFLQKYFAKGVLVGAIKG